MALANAHTRLKLPLLLHTCSATSALTCSLLTGMHPHMAPAGEGAGGAEGQLARPRRP